MDKEERPSSEDSIKYEDNFCDFEDHQSNLSSSSRIEEESEYSSNMPKEQPVLNGSE